MDRDAADDRQGVMGLCTPDAETRSPAGAKMAAAELIRRAAARSLEPWSGFGLNAHHTNVAVWIARGVLHAHATDEDFR